jgi:hypothetical protein
MKALYKIVLVSTSILLVNGSQANEIHRDDWYLNQPDNYATIQLSGHKNEKDALTYIDQLGAVENLGYFQTTNKGLPWYSVTAGAYRSIEEARKELVNLPGNMRVHAPWPRRFSDIQSRIDAPQEEFLQSADLLTKSAKAQDTVPQNNASENIRVILSPETKSSPNEGRSNLDTEKEKAINSQTETSGLSLNFEDADIHALINTVSEITGRNFIVDPRVKGRVTIVSRKNLLRPGIPSAGKSIR